MLWWSSNTASKNNNNKKNQQRELFGLIRFERTIVVWVVLGIDEKKPIKKLKGPQRYWILVRQ